MSVVGGIIGAAGSIIGGNQAAKAQREAARLQHKRFQETKELLNPYTQSGERAIEPYEASLGLRGQEAQQEFFDNFENDPGWQASLDYGTRGLENLNSIRGRGYGGNLIAGLGDYLQKNKLDAYRTRQSQISGLMGMGLNAASSLAGFGQQSAQAQGQNIANAGYYQGAGFANAGNAISNGLNNYAQGQNYASGLSGSNNFFY